MIRFRINYFLFVIALLFLNCISLYLHAQTAKIGEPYLVSEDTFIHDHIDMVFDHSDILPEFPGNYKGYVDFINQNIHTNIPIINNAPAGTYRITVKFTIDKDGSVKDINAVTKCGYGMEEEVIRIFKKSPCWIPGFELDKLNTHVNVYQLETITFTVPDK